MEKTFEKVSGSEFKIVETVAKETIVSVDELLQKKHLLLERINIVNEERDKEIAALNAEINKIDELLNKAKELGISV